LLLHYLPIKTVKLRCNICFWYKISLTSSTFGFVDYNIYLLKPKEKPLEPDPGEHQNNNCNGDGKDKPGSKIDALASWVASG